MNDETRKRIIELMENGEEHLESFIDEYGIECMDDKELVYAAVTINPGNYGFMISDNLKNDKELLLIALKNSGVRRYIKNRPQKREKEYEITRNDLIEEGPSVLCQEIKIPTKFRWNPLIFASKELKNDKDVAIEALKSDLKNWKLLGREIKKDKDFILEVLNENDIYRYLDDELKNDIDILLIQARHQYRHLDDFEKYSDNIKDNKEIALKAVKDDCHNLQFVSDKLKNDKEVVLTAIQSNVDAWTVDENGVFIFASNELRKNKQFIFEIIKINGEEVKNIDDELKKDDSFKMKLIKENGYVLKCFYDEYRNNREIALMAVKSNGGAMEFLCDQYSDDFEIVLAAVSERAHSLRYASARLRKNKDIAMAALDNNYEDAKMFISKELLLDKDIIELINSKENIC